jgi:hypothetical protein
MKAYVVSAHFLDAGPCEVLGAGESRAWAGDLLKKHLDTRHEAAFAGGDWDERLLEIAQDELNDMKASIDYWLADPDGLDYYVRCSDARYWIECTRRSREHTWMDMARQALAPKAPQADGVYYSSGGIDNIGETLHRGRSQEGRCVLAVQHAD